MLINNQDKKGNFRTTGAVNLNVWALSRYDEKSLSNKKPTVTEIANKGMIFGIIEDDKESIWFGAVDGAYRYDGKTVKRL